MRDNRSYLIKKILKQKYPNAKFKVRIEKYTLGESINVYTNLLHDVDYNEKYELEQKMRINGLAGKDLQAYKNIRNKIQRNSEINNSIRTLLKDYYHVNYDEWGNILAGGNTYLHIDILRED